VSVSTYRTTFTLLVNDPLVTTLTYYSPVISLMSNTITIVAGPAPSRRLAAAGFAMPDCSNPATFNFKNKRTAFQTSLYCMFSFPQLSIPTALTQQPYKMSTSCGIIARYFQPTSLYGPSMNFPNRFCSYAPYNGQDACTVNTELEALSSRTCTEYCQNFPGTNRI
jgi:hypothetical protein